MPLDQKENSELLLTAVRNGQLGEVRDLVNCHSLSGFPDFNEGLILLQNALFHGHFEILTFLLQKGAKVYCKKDLLHSPLHLAVFKGHLEIVELLLNFKAPVDCLDECGRTPLHIATLKKLEDITACLISRGASPSKADHNRETPLHLAVHHDLPNMVEILLNSGARVNSYGPGDLTPLHVAAINGSDLIMQILLNNQAKVQLTDQKGYTPLHYAAEHRSPSLVQLLLKNNANINAVCDNGDTPLHLATRHSNLKVVKALAKNCADVNAVNKKGDTPISGLLDQTIIDTLLGFNADLNWQGHLKRNVLHHAISSCKPPKFIIYLLNNGADPNLEDFAGNTPLGLAHLKHSWSDSSSIPDDYDDLSDDDDIVDGLSLQTLSSVSKLSGVIGILKRHLIKMNVADQFVNEKDLSMLYKIKDRSVELFKKECRKELEQIKNEKICEEFTLFDVMTKQRSLNLAKNDSLMGKITSSDFRKYPIYKCLLRSMVSHLKRSKWRLNLVLSGQNSLRILVRVRNLLTEEKAPDLPNELLEKIISLLSDTDVQALNMCRKMLPHTLVHSPSHEND